MSIRVRPVREEPQQVDQQIPVQFLRRAILQVLLNPEHALLPENAQKG